jgi:hypothetical protein
MAYEDEIRHKREIKEQTRQNNREHSEPPPSNNSLAMMQVLTPGNNMLNKIDEEIISINIDNTSMTPETVNNE